MPVSDALSELISQTEGEADVVFLENAVRNIEVGVHDFEFDSTQKVIFDIYAAHAKEETPLLKIQDVVDYEYLVEALQKVLERGRFELLEKIADELLEYILEPNQVVAAMVKITKKEVPGVEGSLGCCITRVK